MPLAHAQLSEGASLIYANVLGVMQDAEEMGGVTSDEDYVLLMEKIAAEAQRRIAALRQNQKSAA